MRPGTRDRTAPRETRIPAAAVEAWDAARSRSSTRGRQPREAQFPGHGKARDAGAQHQHVAIVAHGSQATGPEPGNPSPASDPADFAHQETQAFARAGHSHSPGSSEAGTRAGS
jgi:hypothetical protein